MLRRVVGQATGQRARDKSNFRFLTEQEHFPEEIMKLSFKLSLPLVLLILALVILALVALSPGFVWSQTAPQGVSVASRRGVRTGSPQAPSADHHQRKQFIQPDYSFTFRMIDFPGSVASAGFIAAGSFKPEQNSLRRMT